MTETAAGACPVYVALDMTDTEAAVGLAEKMAGLVAGVKLGLEFFGANGPAGVARVAATGMPIFLDLKFHDIPNTVAGAIRSVLPLAPRLLTIHASGAPAMLRAAADAAAEAGDGAPTVLGVTILTSLDGDDLAAIGMTPDPDAQVLRLAELAKANGLGGLVCSPKEVARVRQAVGPEMTLVIPGIRPAWAAAGDQKRVTTPAQALADGADYLVIGRPITQADDPAAAARRIAEEIAAG